MDFKAYDWVRLTGADWAPLLMQGMTVQVLSRDLATGRPYFAHDVRFHFIYQDEEHDFSAERIER